MDILTVIPAQYDLFVGLDVDKKSYSFTITDHNGWQKAKKMLANPEAFYHYLQRAHPQTRILCAYEAGPTGYRLYDYLMARG